MCFGPQANRRVFRVAVNTLFCGDPAKHPDLAQVLQAMGWDPSKTVLHREHPLLSVRRSHFPVCPPATTVKSALHDRSKQVNVEFSTMLGKLFFHTYFVGSSGVYILKFLVVCLDRVFSSIGSNSISQPQSGKATIFCNCEGNAKIQRVVCVCLEPCGDQDRQHEYVCIARNWRVV